MAAGTNGPCAACKVQRRKCTPECIFAPHFPPDQMDKFSTVHKVYGAANVSKLLEPLHPSQRDDAVNSLAYEADARLRDPVYGCVGLISILQQRLKRLQADLLRARTELSTFIGPAAMQPLPPTPSAAAAADPRRRPQPPPLIPPGLGDAANYLKLQEQFQQHQIMLHQHQQQLIQHQIQRQQQFLQQQQQQQQFQQGGQFFDEQSQIYLEQQQYAAAMARQQEELLRQQQQQQQQQQQTQDFIRVHSTAVSGFDVGGSSSGAVGFNQNSGSDLSSPILALGNSSFDSSCYSHPETQHQQFEHRNQHDHRHYLIGEQTEDEEQQYQLQQLMKLKLDHDDRGKGIMDHDGRGKGIMDIPCKNTHDGV